MRTTRTHETTGPTKRSAEKVLHLFEVLEEEYAAFHREADEEPRSSREEVTAWEFEAADIRDVRRMAELLDAKPGAVEYVAARLADGTRAMLRQYTSTGRPAESEVARTLATELNALLRTELAADPGMRLAAERPFTLGLVEHYPERAEAVSREQLNRWLLEDLFPKVLWRVEDRRIAAVYRKIHRAEHAALCLSGGGIRSATFALGVVQGLARHGLLSKFRYLSTVSGGGYLGSWLSAWMHHTPAEQVVSQLHPHPAPGAGPAGSAATSEKPLGGEGAARRSAPEPYIRSVLKPDPAPIRHLRGFSNYLTPRLGVFSVDTWTLVATVIRNLFLNWLVLVPLLTAVALLPHLASAVVAWAPRPHAQLLPHALIALCVLFGFLLGVVAVAYVHAEPPDDRFRSRLRHARRVGSQAEFRRFCLLPLVGSATLLTTVWAWITNPAWNMIPEPFARVPYLIGFGVLLHLTGWAIGRLPSLWRWRSAPPGGAVVREAGVITATGAIGGAVAYVAARLIEDAVVALARFADGPEVYVVLALPSFLMVLLLGGHLYIGAVSTSRVEALMDDMDVRLRGDDAAREWAARFAAWILIVATVWFAGSALILLGPRLAAEALHLLAGAGLLSGIVAALLGRSPKTSGAADPNGTAPQPSRRSRLRAMALPAAAVFFLAVLVVLLSVLGAALVDLLAGARTALPVPHAVVPRWLVVLCVAAALFGLGCGASFLVDTNKFSLHGMYRMRLIRAYLGASRPAGERRPDPFTGFDEDDNLLMQQLWPARRDSSEIRPPLHVINVALNLVSGQKLAWQERRAESFTITPLHAGAAGVGYRRTSPPSGYDGETPRLYGGAGGVTLGTAMTISGAAANPNMGYFSSPIVTFLMTLFNARLGWWLGNPGPAGQATFDHASPRVGVGPIVAEMFGMTDNQSPYVQLSDGGHFENLGLYEMVRRRCKFIVVSDASCDPDCSLADLGNAIRKIRIDTGVPIEFDSRFDIHPRSSQSRSGGYWARATIRYSAVDRTICPGAEPEALDGTLIYLKPAFYGSEPRDIYNYAHVHRDFPHQSTVDQFFGESQFESYRALGTYVVELVLQELEGGPPDAASDAAPPPEKGSLPWFAYRIRQRGRSDGPRTDADVAAGERSRS